MIKQPVDFVAGALKALESSRTWAPRRPRRSARMGQDLLNPPDVGGWRGGEAWINAGTLFERFNLAERLATGRDPTQAVLHRHPRPGRRHSASRTRARWSTTTWTVLTDGDVTPEARQTLVDYVNADGISAFDASGLDLKARGLVHLAMAVPSYQLG